MMNNTLMAFKIDESDKYDASKNNSENFNNMDFLSAKGRVELLDKITETLDKKPAISERIQAARSQGGLEENEELLTALDDLQMLDMELNRLQDILDNATVIEPLQKGKKKTRGKREDKRGLQTYPRTATEFHLIPTLLGLFIFPHSFFGWSRWNMNFCERRECESLIVFRVVLMPVGLAFPFHVITNRPFISVKK